MRRTPTQPAAIKLLPFIADGAPRKSGWTRCFWNVKPTGSYGKDCKVGEAFALEYLAYGETTHGGTILPHIISDMPRELTGIEVGFLDLVGFAAAHGVHRARALVAYWDQCEKQAAGAATSPCRSPT